MAGQIARPSFFNTKFKDNTNAFVTMVYIQTTITGSFGHLYKKTTLQKGERR